VSYSPSEAVQDEERHLKFLRVLAEKYPDAHKRDGRWFSSELPLEQCDFEIFAEHHPALQRTDIFCRLYVELEGGRVYRPGGGYTGFLSTALNGLKTKSPEAYAALLAEVRKA
jgi:hypothetical protein